MAIAMMVDNPEGSQEGYDAVREQLGLEKPAGRHLSRGVLFRWIRDGYRCDHRAWPRGVWGVVTPPLSRAGFCTRTPSRQPTQRAEKWLSGQILDCLSRSLHADPNYGKYAPFGSRLKLATREFGSSTGH
jgi:hypothetical protein